MKPDLSAFSLALRSLRTARGLSRAKLEAAAGVDRQRIYEFESGLKANPTLDTLTKLATALGCSLDELTGRNGS